MAATERSDEELMQAVQSGDSDAFTDLFHRYYMPLLRYLESRIKRDTDYAADVLQAVFMRIEKHKASFKSGQSFRPWLYAIADRLAKNANRDRYRRLKTVSRFSDAFNVDRPGSSGDGMVETYSSGTGQIDIAVLAPDQCEDNAEREEQLNALPKIVRELPDNLRQVVQFVMTNGTSLRKAEAILGVGRRTLSRRLDEACRIIRDRLEQGDTPDGEYTCRDIQEDAIRDLIDALPFGHYDAIDRAVSEEGDEADFVVLAEVLTNLLGNVTTAAVPV